MSFVLRRRNLVGRFPDRKVMSDRAAARQAIWQREEAEGARRQACNRGRSVLEVTVLDSLGGGRLRDARVSIDGTDLKSTTDDHGSVRMFPSIVGRVCIRTACDSYWGARDSVTLSDADTTRALVRLYRSQYIQASFGPYEPFRDRLGDAHTADESLRVKSNRAPTPDHPHWAALSQSGRSEVGQDPAGDLVKAAEVPAVQSNIESPMRTFFTRAGNSPADRDLNHNGIGDGGETNETRSFSRTAPWRHPGPERPRRTVAAHHPLVVPRRAHAGVFILAHIEPATSLIEQAEIRDSTGSPLDWVKSTLDDGDRYCGRTWRVPIGYRGAVYVKMVLSRRDTLYATVVVDSGRVAR